MELDKLLQRRIVRPGSVESPHDTSLLSAIIDLVTMDEHSNQASQQSRTFTVPMTRRGGNWTVRGSRPTHGR